MTRIDVLNELRSRPWAVHPDYLAGVIHHAQAGTLDAGPVAARSTPPARGLTGVLPIHGFITHRGSALDAMFGVTSVEGIRAGFRRALADERVDTIILDVDSPGGTVAGVDELASEIFQARDQKRLVAVADPLMASAAYWIASAAHEVWVPATGEVGSIGVFAAHLDMSRALDAAGLAVTLVSAGKYKTEGNPYEPLGGDAREHLQSQVDYYYDLFTKTVAKHRAVDVGDVREGYGEGRVLPGKLAVSAGLADRVGDLEAALTRAARSTSPRAETPEVTPTAVAEWRRRRAAWRNRLA